MYALFKDWKMIFALGIICGIFLNSSLGEQYGKVAGKWMRQKLIDYDMLPKAWEIREIKESGDVD